MGATEQPEAPEAGLDSTEAARRLIAHGLNRPPPAPPRRWYLRVWAQLRDPMILVLLAAGVLTAVLRENQNTVIIAAVVLFNTLTGVVQEVRADRAVAALGELTPARSRVLRDGAWRELPAEQVVPGDTVALAAGDLVPADGALTTAVDLEVDESSMTGESWPVARATGDQLTGGTLVTRGRGIAVITRTGSESGLGRLATMLSEARIRATPLQRRLSQLSRRLVLVVGALTGLVVGIGLLQQRPLGEMAIVGVSLAVAAVPESLPAVVAVALALGAHRMARRNAVVRRLPAVETLGSVTVIATDKTGTLTQGRMVAERSWTPPDADPGPAHRRLLRDVVLCNDAGLAAVRGSTSVTGDPLEAALLVLADGAGMDVGAVRSTWPRVAEEPFDHVSRRMGTTHRHADGTELTVHKGAPEAILDLLAPGPDVDEAAGVAADLAGAGYRVIAVADRAGGPVSVAGLVAVADPPRDHAHDVVAACARAGVRVILVTGDHPGTAHAIAARVGIADGRGKPGGRDAGADRSVFARVQPEEKVAIVRGLQDAGEVVAMLGDGVNDAPALRTADIGVAAGRGGTEVARQAADLVLLDDDLGTVVAAIEEGRRIFANIRSFLVYAVSGGLAEVAVMLLGPAVGIALPLLPAQILWINLMTHGMTGVAFGAEPADPAEMRRPPRPPDEAVLTRRLSLHLAVAATGLTVAALAATRLGESTADVRTSVFLTLGLGQLGVAWAIRARPAARTLHTRGLEVATAGAALLLLAATAFGPFQELLDTRALGAGATAGALALAALPGLLVRGLVTRARRRPGGDLG